MNNSQKRFKALTAMAVIVVASAFTINLESAISAPSQSPPLINASANTSTKTSANTSVKTMKKRVITPNQACKFLNKLDMPTRDYTDTFGPNKYGKYEADSDRLLLETRDSNRYNNNISYSVFGSKFVAKAVELDMAVNDLSFSSNAVVEFTKYADALMLKATGEKLTPQLKKAIQSKTTGDWVVNGYKIKLVKEIFPDEKVIKGIAPTSDHGAFSLSFIIEL